MHDVTIIGAGPGGALAAILLARRGWDVTLIEQHRFPRDKVCGECVSALGVEALGRSGLIPELQDAGAIRLTRAILHDRNGNRVESLLPRPMLGISRRAMDDLLLQAARRAGAALLQPVRVEAMQFDAGNPFNSSVHLRIRDLQNNALRTLTPSLVILADGKSALPSSPPKASGDIGIKAHWENVSGPRDAIELFGCAGCYGGLAPIEADRCNTAFSVPAARLRAHRGDIDALFEELLGENPSLCRRLAGAKRIGGWLAAPLPRFGVARKWRPNVIPVGNAAAALEPIGGEGMGLALRSSELAANALTEHRAAWNEVRARRLRRAYERLWRPRSVACRAAAKVVSSPYGAAALAFLRNRQSAATFVLQRMGK